MFFRKKQNFQLFLKNDYDIISLKHPYQYCAKKKKKK